MTSFSCTKFKLHLLINLPFIITNVIFLFITIEYYRNYLLLFIPETYTFKLFTYKNDFFYSKFYLQKIFPRNFKLIGLSTLVAFSLSQFMSFISLYRVFFSNPGYLATPLQLEWKTIKQKTNKQSITKACNNLNDKLDQLSQIGPLTYVEYDIMLRRLLAKDCIDNTQTDNNHHYILSISNISSNQINSINPLPFEVSQMTLCGKCLRYKPERAHHCSQCNKCVMKMDHHCPWIANCIGLMNYKYFFLTLIYTFASSSIVLITLWESILIMISSSKIPLYHCVLCSFAYICNIIVWLFTGYLGIMNIQLVSINKTTIELADETRFKMLQDSQSKEQVETTDNTLFDYSKYDKGTLANLKEVFGNYIILWGLPFC